MKPSSEIATLKAQLAEARLDLAKKQKLASQREEAEARLEGMRRELEGIKKKLYQTASDRQPLESRAEQLENQIALLRQTLTHLDHQLDHLDEDFEERTEELKKRLIQSILVAHPQKTGELDALQAALAQRLQQQARLQDILEDCRQIAGYLLKGRETALSTKGRGLLGYIMGANPNVIISQCLARGVEVAKECLKSKLPHLHLEEQNPLLTRLKECLSAISEEAAKPWSFKRVHHTIGPLAEGLEALIQQFETASEKQNAAVLEQEESLEKWLENHCGAA